MPNRAYQKGIRYEYRVKNRLKKEGWTVLRTAGSRGDFDLIAIKPEPVSKIKLIQCKSGKSKEEAIEAVRRSGLISRFEGVYRVTVELL